MNTARVNYMLREVIMSQNLCRETMGIGDTFNSQIPPKASTYSLQINSQARWQPYSITREIKSRKIHGRVKAKEIKTEGHQASDPQLEKVLERMEVWAPQQKRKVVTTLQGNIRAIS
jgi:hypothetical protein